MKMASISSMFFGLMYGSIFGIEGVIPEIWLNPMHDVNKLLAVSIGLGVFMISLGLLLNMIKQYRAKDFGRLLFDGQGLAGLALYWTLCALGMIYITGSPISEFTADLMWGAISRATYCGRRVTENPPCSTYLRSCTTSCPSSQIQRRSYDWRPLRLTTWDFRLR